jgi:flagellar hook-associated protein 2
VEERAVTSPISFSGLASGLDTASIVKQLVSVESQPITRMQKQQTDIDAKSKKLTTLQGNLDDLRNAALGLDTRSEALPTQATSSNSAVVSATATGGASLGSYQLKVTQLASAARVYSNSFSASDVAGLFGTGTMSMAIGGQNYPITLDGTDTLASVVSKIQASGAPVSAGLLFDGTGYRLAISGNASGAANALTIDEGGLTLGVSNPANVASKGLDAKFDIDGIHVTRSSNVVADALTGVTLQLKGLSATGATEHVDVGNDPSALVANVKKLVDAYNKVNTFISGEEDWSGQAKDATSLNGDSTLRSVQGQLHSAILSPIAGTAGKYTTLASLGISMQKDGSLALDESKLQTALGADPEAVATVLGHKGTGAMTVIAQAADYFSDTSTGVLTQRLASMTKQRRALDDSIAQMQTRIDQYQTLLQAQFATLETTMSALKSQGDQLTAAMTAMSNANNGK